MICLSWAVVEFLKSFFRRPIAACSMSTVVSPEAAAVDLEAPLTEWALKIPVSIPDSRK